MRFRAFFTSAALAALLVPIVQADDRKQVAPISIDLQGRTADGQRLAGRAILTPLEDGRVQVQHPIRQLDGRTRIQSGVGTLQGNTIHVDLEPTYGGATQILDDGHGAQQGTLPVTIAIDPQSGAVQSQGPGFQATAPRSSKVKQFFAMLGGKAKAGWNKTKGFFGRIWSAIKGFFSKIRARFSRNREAPVVDSPARMPGCHEQGPPPTRVRPTPIIDIAPGIEPTPITDLDEVGPTPITDLDSPILIDEPPVPTLIPPGEATPVG